jgi:hypothetical protein
LIGWLAVGVGDATIPVGIIIVVGSTVADD